VRRALALLLLLAGCDGGEWFNPKDHKCTSDDDCPVPFLCNTQLQRCQFSESERIDGEIDPCAVCRKAHACCKAALMDEARCAADMETGFRCGGLGTVAERVALAVDACMPARDAYLAMSPEAAAQCR